MIDCRSYEIDMHLLEWRFKFSVERALRKDSLMTKTSSLDALESDYTIMHSSFPLLMPCD